MKKIEELLFLKNIKGIGKKTIYSKYWSALKTSKGIDELKEIVRKKDTKITEGNIEEAIRKSEEVLSIINHTDIKAITVFDENYPDRLEVMGDSRPIILYIRGNERALEAKNIAVIGTREPSKWSVQVETNLVKQILNQSDLAVVSGLALGCDKIAHETTVQEGKMTVAVLPSGLNEITPSSHKSLAEDIIKNDGCLITEYEPNAKATTSSYVERDAIIAAFADTTIVVECGVESGTMHTVNAAERYNKRIACYYSENAGLGAYEGNEYIIKNKGAVRLTDTQDLIAFIHGADLIVEPIPGKGDARQMTLFDFDVADDAKSRQEI